MATSKNEAMPEIDPEQCYHDARRLVRVGDYKKAHVMLRLAIQHAPENNTYLSLHQSVQYHLQNPDREKDSLLIELEEKPEEDTRKPRKSKQKSKSPLHSALIALFAVSAGLAIGLGAYWIIYGWGYGDDVSLGDYATHMAFIDVQDNQKGLLTLTIELEDLNNYPQTEQALKLDAILRQSKVDGFREVAVVDLNGALLATSHLGKLTLVQTEKVKQ